MFPVRFSLIHAQKKYWRTNFQIAHKNYTKNWAKLKGEGAKRSDKQSLVRMAPWKELFGTWGNTINTKIFAIQKKFLRGINIVKITENIFQSTRLPEERMGVAKKIGGRNEFP